MIPKRQRGLQFGSDDYVRWFWSNVDQSGDCWRWLGSVQSRKRMYYGNCWRDGRWDKAHRVAWELKRGPVPAGLVVMHTCDHGWCVRPGHLALGEAASNAQDQKRKGRSRRGVRVDPPPQGQLALV